jgi:hypothetical protein
MQDRKTLMQILFFPWLIVTFIGSKEGQVFGFEKSINRLASILSISKA